MSKLTRRSFLAAAGALAASHAHGASREKSKATRGEPRSGIDVVIIGAGAAGIAAARRMVLAGKKCVVLEASGATGGRCRTDSATFGIPYDHGARAFYTPQSNPVARLAIQNRFDIYPVPPGQRLRISRRYARESEVEDMLSAMVRANAGIADVARKADVACAQALPQDLGEWRSTIEFMLGPSFCGKDLTDVSTVDLARAAERNVQAFCRQGVGAVIAKLAADLPVRLSTPATRISWGGRAGVEVETAQGPIDARAVIITVSTNVLAAGKLDFAPDLPKRQFDAIQQLRLGSYDHITLELPGNPLGLRTDEQVFERSSTPRTGALFGNMSGSSLCTVNVGGRFGRDLAAKGTDAMIAFALDWLDGLYGTALKRGVGRTHATRWNAEPWILGAMSAAAPGGQAARRTLMDAVNNRIWFAGEAVHERLWGTVAGAWESGDRAALAALSVIAPTPEQKQQQKQPRRPAKPPRKG